MNNCKICNEPTEVIFVIKFKPVSICEGCARTITEQQIVAMFARANGSEVKPYADPAIKAREFVGEFGRSRP
jgi:hypothetical protein